MLYGLILDGTPYRGFLYCGLMLTADGPKVIEFNVRFGDPEAQVVLPMIAQPLAPILWAAATGVLRSVACRDECRSARRGGARGRGISRRDRTGQRIEGLDDVDDALVFFAGVKSHDGALVTSGGRVLTVVGKGATFRGRDRARVRRRLAHSLRRHAVPSRHRAKAL